MYDFVDTEQFAVASKIPYFSDLSISPRSAADPSLFIVEYDGKFPPPVRFSVAYDARYTWSGSDYFGASLQSFVDLFESSGFRLVCCNVTGANVFFVVGRRAKLFDDAPNDIAQLFMPLDYNWFVRRGHSADPRSIEHFLAEE